MAPGWFLLSYIWALIIDRVPVSNIHCHRFVFYRFCLLASLFQQNIRLRTHNLLLIILYNIHMFMYTNSLMVNRFLTKYILSLSRQSKLQCLNTTLKIINYIMMTMMIIIVTIMTTTIQVTIIIVII